MSKINILGIVGSLGMARAQYHLRQIPVTLNMPAVNQPKVMIRECHSTFR